MRLVLPILALAGFVLSDSTRAQQRGAQAPVRPLMECGAQGDLEILCGTRSPEDLEATPDGKFILVSQFVNAARGGGEGAGFALFDPEKKTFAKMAFTSEPLKGWGDPKCPGHIGEALAPHGISLLKRSDGKFELYVVNHGGRESIEMFELVSGAGGWALVWRGCVVSKEAFNDVAALSNGGFYATHPTALQTPGFDLFSGRPSGWVASWIPGKGESELPGTRAGYPNGVVVDAEGRFLYYNAWTAKEVHKYDLKKKLEVKVLSLDFMPDNLTWTKQGHILAAGVKGARGACPEDSGTPCIQSFSVVEIEPDTLRGKTVFNSEAKGPLIAGVSVALQFGRAIYVGAFQGDRLVRIPWTQYN